MHIVNNVLAAEVSLDRFIAYGTIRWCWRTRQAFDLFSTDWIQVHSTILPRLGRVLKPASLSSRSETVTSSMEGKRLRRYTLVLRVAEDTFMLGDNVNPQKDPELLASAVTECQQTTTVSDAGSTYAHHIEQTSLPAQGRPDRDCGYGRGSNHTSYFR